MSTLLRMILGMGGGGSAELAVRNVVSPEGIGQLCSSVPCEFLVAQPTSIYTLSITEIRLVAQPPSVAPSLCTTASEVLTPTPTSVYNLSTAVT